MLIATWNLNNRVGKRQFRPEAADAAIALGADIMVFTEFFPGSHLVSFQTKLEDGGWPYQLLSEDTGEISNRILIVSKVPLEPLSLNLPTFDKQFPANLLCAFIPSLDISLIGVRVPAYYGTKTASMLLPTWNWLEETAQALRGQPSIILGDLNVSLESPRSKGEITSGESSKTIGIVHYPQEMQAISVMVIFAPKLTILLEPSTALLLTPSMSKSLASSL